MVKTQTQVRIRYANPQQRTLEVTIPISLAEVGGFSANDLLQADIQDHSGIKYLRFHKLDGSVNDAV